jgi:hypothetical protein
MTWAQCTFAYCFLVFIPTMGAITARRYRKEGKSRFSGFVAGTFLGGITFIACCLLAKVSFPRYPAEPLSEWIANAFTLPMPAACLLLAWRSPKIDVENGGISRRAALMIGVLYIGCVGLGLRATMWEFRTALPWSAREVHEYSWSSSIPADHTYWLKARITRPEFDAYITKWDLTLYSRTPPSSAVSPGQTDTNINRDDWRGPNWNTHDPMLRKSELSWWDPSPDLSETYFKAYRTGALQAKYEGGYLYFRSWDH